MKLFRFFTYFHGRISRVALVAWLAHGGGRRGHAGGRVTLTGGPTAGRLLAAAVLVAHEVFEPLEQLGALK